MLLWLAPLAALVTDVGLAAPARGPGALPLTYPSDVPHGRHAAFLRGDFSEFGAWAAHWQEPGAEALRVPVPDTPHARFWDALVRDPTRRQALLSFLRRSHSAWIPSPRARPTVACEATCRHALLTYLDAFPDPRHLPSQRRLLGSARLALHSHQPDEAIVALSGDLGLAAALPSLWRFLRAERRFYWLQTDHPTRPQEVGRLFESALEAVVKIARAHPARRAEVQAGLGALLEDLRIPDGARNGREACWLEVYDDDDYGEAEPPPQATSATRVFVSRSSAKTRSKVPLLERARAALARNPDPKR